MMNIIQAILSTVLFYYSIFKAHDHEVKTTNKGVLVDKSSIITDKKNGEYQSKNKFLLQISILEIKQHKFSTKYAKSHSLAIKRTELYSRLESYKLKFYLKFKKSINESDLESDMNEYESKKSMYDVIMFNQQIMETFNKKFNILSPQIIQLKNLNELITNKFSLDLQEHRNKNLAHLYENLCRSYLFFASEFLKFVNLNDEELIEKMKTSFHNNYDIQYDSSRSFKDSQKIFSENEDSSIVSNDIIKTMKFLNNILTVNNYISVYSKGYNCKKQVYEFSLMFKETDIMYIRITLSYSEFIELCNIKQYKEVAILEKLKYVLLNRNQIAAEKGEKYVNDKVAAVLKHMLNNLLFYNAKMFKILKLNNFLKLELQEIDIDLVNSFFELDRSSNLNLNFLESSVLNEKNLLDFVIKCEFLKIEKVETIHNSSFLQIYLKVIQTSKATDEIIRIWKIETSLNDLLQTLKEIDILASKKFISLHTLVQAIENQIQNLLKNHQSEEVGNQFSSTLRSKGMFNYPPLESSSDRNSLISKEQFQEPYILLVDLINELFISKNLYSLYSDSIRKEFNVFKMFEHFDDMYDENENSIVSEAKLNPSSDKSLLDNLLS